MTKAREIASTPETVLASGTLTAAAQLNLSNILSNSYRFYTFNFYSYTGSGNQQFYMRFRENTTDRATAYYGGGYYMMFNGSGGAYATNNATQMTLPAGGQFTSSAVSVSATITRPSATTGVLSYLGYDYPSSAGVFYSAYNDGMSNFNGLSFYPAGSTMTGYYILTGRRV